MFENIFDMSLLAAAIRTTTPIILAGLGGAFTTKSGIFNIALEGKMLIASFFAVIVSYYTGSAWLGVLGGVLASVIFSLIFALFAVTFKSNVIVVGLALNILASGATISLMVSIFGTRGSIISPNIIGLPTIYLPFADKLGSFGQLISGYTPLVYITLLLVILVIIIMKKTKLGLYTRVVGEKEEAIEAVGIKTNVIKYSSSIICGIMCGLAGAHISLGHVTMFSEGMSSGRGFMALAALIFSNGEPISLLLGSFLFGFADAMSLRLQQIGIPSYLVLTIPYLITLISLFTISYIRRPKIFKETSETIKKYLSANNEFEKID